MRKKCKPFGGRSIYTYPMIGEKNNSRPKKKAIKIISEIWTSGRTPNRDSYPKEWRGECVEWNNPHFHLGMEYGYILALMCVFNITKEEVDNAK